MGTGQQSERVQPIRLVAVLPRRLSIDSTENIRWEIAKEEVRVTYSDPEKGIARAQAVMWAEETTARARAFREVFQRASSVDKAYERGWDEHLTEEDVRRVSDELFLAAYYCVIAARNLERWASRMSADLAQVAPTVVPLLTHLRNALEHLDEAQLDDFVARPPSPKGQAGRSLRELPGGELPWGAHWDSQRLFGIVPVSDVEQSANEIATQIWDEDVQPLVDHYLEWEDEERRGR